MLRNSTFLLLLAALFLSVQVEAQDVRGLALQNIQTEYEKLGLSAEDVLEISIRDQYTSNGVEHVFVQQYLNGVPVYNGQASLHFVNGQLKHRTSDLYAGLEERPVSVPTLTATEALLIAARPLDITKSTSPRQIGLEDDQITFSWPEVAKEDITAKLFMVPHEGKLVVAWQFVIDQANTLDVWITQVDATRGQLIARYNQTLYCSFNDHAHFGKGHSKICLSNVDPELQAPKQFHEAVLEATVVDGAKYNVFPLGIESPTYGEREIIENPADPVFSPFGWHDTNGQDGAEFTTTRGNNVRAFLDRDGNGSPDAGGFAEGGDSLVFDYFYESGITPDSFSGSAPTQLFYMNNIMHDFAYAHGFDEASGNFQRNNYGNGGTGNDEVLAQAQDGSGVNNATFGTPADGGSGSMSMFLWENGSPTVLNIDSPSSIAVTVEAGRAIYGPQERPEPITGEVAIAVDGTANPELVCESVVNGDEVSGKIALIRRGDCFFEQKALNAEAAGAIAYIICNPENTILNMAGGVDDDEPTIHGILVFESVCQEIRAQISAGNPVTVTIPAIQDLPAVDGDFDNGIVAHEYGHGITNRLVGGRFNAGCLGNEEQMGEGWSDFYALATSPINGSATMPDGTERRGIGNYATSRGPNGGGIRRLPYSTSMDVNDHTYDAVITSGIPHPLGEIWATTLWDLYWAMVEDHGFDEDLINGDGGNNVAVSLVTEGLKYTSCNPGLVSGRDGILAADEILYEGANTCRIWEVFARRGLGFSAIQGSTSNRFDNREAFDVNPACIPTVKMAKVANTGTIVAGEEVTYTITVRNDKAETATDIVITDEIPDGMTFIASSVNGVESFLVGTGSVIFNVGDLEPEGEEIFTYRVETADDRGSVGYFFDGAEDDDENWTIEPLNAEGTFIWEQTDEDVFEGDFAWFVQNAEENNDQVLQIFEPFELVGNRPAVRFFTQYDTEAGWDGGLVEMSTDGINWTNVGNDRFIRGGYRGEIQQSAFDASVADLSAYWGNSNGYFDAYLDFADMAGEEVYLRWRFGSDDNTVGEGWWVDNIEVIDLFSYEPMAVLTSGTDDNATAVAPDGGVIVDTDFQSDVVDPNLGLTSVKVFPNPANEVVKVFVNSEISGDVTVQLIGVDGRLVAQRELDLVSGGQLAQFNTTALPAGVYVVQVLGADRIHTEKVTIQ